MNLDYCLHHCHGCSHSYSYGYHHRMDRNRIHIQTLWVQLPRQKRHLHADTLVVQGLVEVELVVEVERMGSTYTHWVSAKRQKKKAENR